MSSLFNQTNIAPGTSFASGGGSNLNPTIQTITASGNPTNYLNMTDVNNNIRMATGASSFIVSYNSPTDTRIEMNPVGGVKLGFWNSGTTSGGFWATGNNIAPPNWGVQLNYISSINDGSVADVINMTALVSTLKVAYPGTVS